MGNYTEHLAVLRNGIEDLERSCTNILEKLSFNILKALQKASHRQDYSRFKQRCVFLQTAANTILSNVDWNNSL